MPREFSTTTPPTPIRPQQLNTAPSRSQRNQVNAMIRLAKRHERKVEQDGLKMLLQSFETFSDEYATVLEGATRAGDVSYLLRSGIERLLQEWSILSRACEQRAETDPRYMKSDDRQQSPRYYLEQADKLLAEYCGRWNPSEDAAYARLKTPVVYFEKLYRISRALFAPDVPVVSIPLSDYDAPDRWQALAHEMGHHVFWNAVDLDEFRDFQDRLCLAVAEALLKKHGVTTYDADHPVDKKLVSRIDLWGSWLEEVFADVCGVLFAGPAFAYSAQGLAAASISGPEDLIGASDHEHPSLYLRPLISLQVVRALADATPRESDRQALLDWAGVGETENMRRAPDYEKQSTDWSSGKRIPAEATMSLSGYQRWQNFTGEAANEVLCTAESTMAELADDVPTVVDAVLHAQIWPSGKCLWDLVEPYGSQPGSAVVDFPEVLAALPWNVLPPMLRKPMFKPLPVLTSATSTDLTRVMQRIMDEVNSQDMDVQESERPRIFWTRLSTLDVVSDVKGIQPHDWTNDHFHGHVGKKILNQSHKHNATGSKTEWR